jgi:hypothetical protein
VTVLEMDIDQEPVRGRGQGCTKSPTVYDSQRGGLLGLGPEPGRGPGSDTCAVTYGGAVQWLDGLESLVRRNRAHVKLARETRR